MLIRDAVVRKLQLPLFNNLKQKQTKNTLNNSVNLSDNKKKLSTKIKVMHFFAYELSP